MILSHMAPSSLNMSPYRAIWTHFRSNSMMFVKHIIPVKYPNSLMVCGSTVAYLNSCLKACQNSCLNSCWNLLDIPLSLCGRPLYSVHPYPSGVDPYEQPSVTGVEPHYRPTSTDRALWQQSMHLQIDPYTCKINAYADVYQTWIGIYIDPCQKRVDCYILGL